MTPSPTFFFSTFDTALGEYSVAVDADGAVVATAFGGEARLAKSLGRAVLVADAARTAPAREQLTAWFKGERNDFSLRLAAEGTPFQKRVWAALLTIPYGETCSYGDIARSVGSSPRAVGRANGSNPIGVIVPCHRVNGADGSLTGYASGVETKRRLLDLEARRVSPSGSRAHRGDKGLQLGLVLDAGS